MDVNGLTETRCWFGHEGEREVKATYIVENKEKPPGFCPWNMGGVRCEVEHRASSRP